MTATRRKASARGDEDAKTRNWKVVLYPDSCGGGWLETGAVDERGYPTDDLEGLLDRLEEQIRVPVCVSPIHHADLLRDGTPEKKHIHLILTFAGNKTYSQVLQMFEPFGVKIVKVCDELRTAERYLCHLDTRSKRKAHYPIEKLVCLNGYVCKFVAEQEEQSEFVQLIDLIEKNGIILFADFGYTVAHEKPQLIRCMNRYTSFFNNYCTSRERLINREIKRNGVKSEKGITPLMSSYKSYRVIFGGQK